MLSVIIPTLNAEKSIEAAISSCKDESSRALVEEVIVCDGGSQDGTSHIARDIGARLIVSDKGRGVQLAAGAAAARGRWFLFLHSDTRLEAGWGEEAGAFARAAEAEGAERAAAFAFRLDDAAYQARILETIVAWRCRYLGLAYGDQGLLISRGFYERLGGFRPIALMEDVDLVRRIGRRHMHILHHAAVTGAVRYRREGYVRRMFKNAFCLSLWFAGVNPDRIVKVYR